MTHPLSMSGLHTLDENQTYLFEAMNLEVPPMMTVAQLTELLKQVESHCEQDVHPMLSPSVLKVVTQIRIDHGLAG